MVIRSKLISNAPHKGIKVGVKLTKEAEAEERLSAPFWLGLGRGMAAWSLLCANYGGRRSTLSN